MYARIKIAIADDHEIFREGFKLLLRDQNEVQLVGEAEHGRELLKVLEEAKPDVVIVDIKMPVLDGVDACKAIRKKFPDVQVIALSMFNEDSLIVDMLEAGAKGYLLKNTNKQELLTAVRAVYEGNTYYCSATSEKLTRMIADSKFNPYRNQPIVRFTPRELDIIKLMCQQYTSKEIASKLTLSIRTVESHREKLQEKTGAKNAIGIVIYAIKHDLVVV
ncbi:MAG: response regulator transcription factor [Chitinophagaceae bacterium]|nr:response regulator transcription factor [Chitinophagaceae bacterium]